MEATWEHYFRQDLAKWQNNINSFLSKKITLDPERVQSLKLVPTRYYLSSPSYLTVKNGYPNSGLHATKLQGDLQLLTFTESTRGENDFLGVKSWLLLVVDPKRFLHLQGGKGWLLFAVDPKWFLHLHGGKRWLLFVVYPKWFLHLQRRWWLRDA